ncbi:MAG: class I SAM-dependent methyltransferase, partial [Rhodospirillaceae bacterium]
MTQSETSDTFEKESHFWDKTAAKYARSPVRNPEAYALTMERSISYLSPEHDVLEIGCGTGTTALIQAPNVRHITASDVSANMIEIAKVKARDQNIQNVTFVQAPAPGPQMTPETFDAVLAYNVLHLLKDLPAVLRAVHAAL